MPSHFTPPQKKTFDPADVALQAAAAHRVNTLVVVPAMLAALLDACDKAPPVVAAVLRDACWRRAYRRIRSIKWCCWRPVGAATASW